VCYASTNLTPAVRSELCTIRQALRLNLAFDGAATSPITNLKMYVDYVREFQLQPGVRVHAPPSVGLGGNWWTGEPLVAFTNQPLPLACTIEGDGMPGGGLIVEWQQLNGPARATFTTTTALQTTVTFPAAGMYDIRAVGHDGQYGSYAWRRVVVTDGSGNTPPQVAASDRKVMAGHPMKMEVAVADDGRPGGTPTVTWYKMLGQEPTFSDVHSRTPTVTFDYPGTVFLGVTANDGALDSTEAMVTVTVVDAVTNQAPQVSAGGSLNVAPGTAVTLPGSVSDDGYPEFRTTQKWTQVSGPATVAIEQSTWASSPASFPVAGTYVLRLTAADGAATASDTLTVVVGGSGNHAPKITTAKPAALACSLNTAATVQLAATDADVGDTLTWSVATASAHGSATVGATGLARYTPANGYLGTDAFAVRVSDGHGGTDAITINCTVSGTTPKVTAVVAMPAVVAATGSTITISATVLAGTGHPIDHVAFSLDGTTLGNGTYDSGSGTWKLDWVPSSLGRQTITATAYGNDAQTATATVVVVVGTAGTYGNGDASWAVGFGTLRLEAENYDEGGEGVAFHDTDSRQGPSAVRNDGGDYKVDIVELDSGSDVPAQAIGYTEAGEWLRYTLTVPTTARYTVRLRVANGTGSDSANALSLRWKGAVVVGPLSVPTTGAWDQYTTLEVGGVELGAGTDLLQLDCNTPGFDCNWIEFVPEEGRTYASWIAGYFPEAGGDEAIVGAAADPDGDGLNNLLEYGLGRAPNAAEPPLAVSVVVDGGEQYCALTFRRAVGVSVVAEVSEDLIIWSSGTTDLIQQGLAIPDASGLFEDVTFRSTLPLAAKPRQFLRLRVTWP
jgi:VCBS repeat-containing protein